MTGDHEEEKSLLYLEFHDSEATRPGKGFSDPSFAYLASFAIKVLTISLTWRVFPSKSLTTQNHCGCQPHQSGSQKTNVTEIHFGTTEL